MKQVILALNAGSSSVKFRLFGQDENLPLLAGGQISGIGTQPEFQAVKDGRKLSNKKLSVGCNHHHAVETILQWIETNEDEWVIAAAGHRVVHGGAVFDGPAVVDDVVMAALRKLSPLAPLHQPQNLAAIDIVSKLRPGLRQVACFDTAFHARHDPLFRVYALPRELTDNGIRRYGFHGLSYEWIVRCLKRDHPDFAKGRVVAAHLGSGASLCALKNCLSIDTTMGMTALEGLPMGTRSGNLDPGAIIFMVRELGLSIEAVESLLYNESGLKGLSGISSDVKKLLESDSRDARFALDYFSLKTAQFVSAMAVSMGGIDAVVFTGGIGENAKSVRDSIMKHLDCLGRPQLLVIPANEEYMIAFHVRDICF